MTSSSYDNIASPNRGSTGFQTHLERRFTPGRFGGSAMRQVWKSTLRTPRALRSRKTVISRIWKSAWAEA